MARVLKFTDEQKMEIALEIISDKISVFEICRKYNIANSYAYKLIDRAMELLRNWDVVVRVELEVLAEQIRCLTKSISKLDDQMSGHGRNLKGYKNLSSIKSIGERLATVLLSVIDDVNDFAD